MCNCTQVSVAGALRNLSSLEAHRPLLLDAGALKVLENAAARWSGNERLLADVTGARRNLLGEEAVPATAGGMGGGGGDFGGKTRKKKEKKLKLPPAPEGEGKGDVPLSQRNSEGGGGKKKKSTLFGGLTRKKKS